MYGFALLWWWRYDTETLFALQAAKFSVPRSKIILRLQIQKKG